jgi:hypothetical protein
VKTFDKVNIGTALLYAGIIACLVFTFFISTLNKENINSLERLTNQSDEKLESLKIKNMTLGNKLNFTLANIPETVFYKPKIIYIRIPSNTVYKTLYIDNTDTKTITQLRQNQNRDSIKIISLLNDTANLTNQIRQLRESYIFCSEGQVPSLKQIIDSLRLQVDTLQIQLNESKRRRGVFNNFGRQE